MTADAILRLVFKGQNDAQAAMNQVRQQMDSVGQAAAKASAAMRTAGTVMTAALTAPILLMGNKMVTAASDLNETVSKTQAIFKTNSAEMIAWSKTTTASMGLSQRAALDYATGFATMLKNIGGQSEEQAGKTSKMLTGLTSDLSSFFNTSQEDAAGALRSALTGEFEPMKRFGVVLNETTLKQEALTMGLYKGKGEMSQQAKQAATLALIMKNTADAQGDYARTAEGLANKQRSVAAEIENLSAQIGEVLLPHKLKLLEVVSDLVGWMSKLSPEMKRMGVYIAAAAAAAGPLLVVMGSIMPALSGLGSVLKFVAGAGFLPLVGVIGAVVGAGYLLWKNWAAISGWARELVDGVMESFTKWREDNAGLIDEVLEKWDNLKIQAQNAFNAVMAAMAPVWDAIVQGVASVTGPMGGFEENMHGLGTAALELASLLMTKLGEAFQWLTANAAQIVTRVSGAVNTMFGVVRSVIAGVVQAFNDWRERNSETIAVVVRTLQGMWENFKAIGASIGVILQALATGIGEATAWMVAKLNEWLAPIGGIKGAWEILLDTVTNVVKFIVDVVGGFVGLMRTGFETIAQIMTDQLNPWEDFKFLISDAVESVKAKIREMVANVVQEVREMGAKLLQAGKDAMEGLKQGIQGKINDVKTAAGNVAGGAINAVKGIFQTKSPSKVLRQIGQWFSQGLGLGIMDGGAEARKAAATVADGTIAEMEGRIREARKRMKGAKIGSAEYLAAEQDMKRAQDDKAAAQGGRPDDAGSNPLLQFSEQLTQNMTFVQQAAMMANDAYQGIAGSIQGIITGTMTWGQALRNVGLTIGQSIIKSIADATASWITQHVILRGLMAATSAFGLGLRAKETAATVTSETTKAAAAAPAAALTSISSFGSAAVIGIAALVAAMAVAKSFYTGGYTGDGDRRKFAGVVEHEEFVVNAAGTAMNRSYLEYANQGGNLGRLFGRASGGYAAGATVPMPDGGRAERGATVILVDSREAAERAAASMDGPVTIQMVREEISRFRA